MVIFSSILAGIIPKLHYCTSFMGFCLFSFTYGSSFHFEFIFGFYCFPWVFLFCYFEFLDYFITFGTE